MDSTPDPRRTNPQGADPLDPTQLDPDTVAAYYQLLEIQPGATIEEVDQAYFRLRRRATTAPERSALKTAHQAVKAMLIHYFSEADSPAGHSSTPEGGSGVTAPAYHQHLCQQITRWIRDQGIEAEVTLSDRHLHISCSALQHPRPQPTIGKIKRALQKLATAERLLMDGVKVYGMQRPKHALWKQAFSLPSPRSDAQMGQGKIFGDRTWGDLVAFPVLSVIAIGLNAFPLTDFLLVGIRIWVHELGHATIAWLSGYRAIPLPFGWTNVDDHHSLWVYVSVLALIGLFGWANFREQHRWGMAIAGILAIVQLIFTWGISADTYGLLLSFGGVGGEFYLSTLLMVAFFFPLPEYFRWEINRFPVTLCGAITFWNAFFLWQKISRGQAFIPWGSLLGGEGDAGGDMNVLVDYGWSHDRIIDTYHTLGNVCLWVILGFYLYHGVFYYLNTHRH